MSASTKDVERPSKRAASTHATKTPTSLTKICKDTNRTLEPRGQSVGHWGNDDTAQGDLLTPQWQRTHLALPTHLALSVLFQVALG
jgi:hypothetical protein